MVESAGGLTHAERADVLKCEEWGGGRGAGRTDVVERREDVQNYKEIKAERRGKMAGRRGDDGRDGRE